MFYVLMKTILSSIFFRLAIFPENNVPARPEGFRGQVAGLRDDEPVDRAILADVRVSGRIGHELRRVWSLGVGGTGTEFCSLVGKSNRTDNFQLGCWLGIDLGAAFCNAWVWTGNEENVPTRRAHFRKGERWFFFKFI